MSKFKLGARVRFHGKYSGAAGDVLNYPEDAECVGLEGVVEERTGCPRVRMDSGHILTGWSDERYELVAGSKPATEPVFDLLSALTGKPLKFRSGGEVKFVAYAPDAKPHCQLVLLSIATGNIVLRYANGKGSDEPYSEPGDILNAEAV